jgi:hypothetical protein
MDRVCMMIISGNADIRVHTYQNITIPPISLHGTSRTDSRPHRVCPHKQGSESPQHLAILAFSEPQLLLLLLHTNFFFST